MFGNLSGQQNMERIATLGPAANLAPMAAASNPTDYSGVRVRIIEQPKRLVRFRLSSRSHLSLLLLIGFHGYTDAHSQTYTHTHVHTHSHAHTLTFTHTHMHTHSHALTCTHPFPNLHSQKHTFSILHSPAHTPMRKHQ